MTDTMTEPVKDTDDGPDRPGGLAALGGPAIVSRRVRPTAAATAPVGRGLRRRQGVERDLERRVGESERLQPLPAGALFVRPGRLRVSARVDQTVAPGA
ncbi:hypothetical protein [Streptomyces sp. NPDC090445]|uniref:hypothetical protein n=1 Tax=Streptomyces sp. NPDC090445 TaxID=3365963 RepID=UPI0037F443A5